jgi:hypothetical protein
MAGDWLKVEKNTPEKPEILALADLLQISVADVFLACFKIWRWADSHTSDGYAQGVTEAHLDGLSGVSGLASALSKVGWLQARKGSLVVPHFERHMSQGAKTRALTAARMARSRGKKSDARSVTEASPDKIREDKNKDPPNPPAIPETLKTPAFVEAWDRWNRYKRESRKTLRPSTAALQLKKLAKFGPETAIAAIEASIANGWIGLFPESVSEGDHARPGGNVRSPSRVRASSGELDAIDRKTIRSGGPGASGAASADPSANGEPGHCGD